MSIQDYFVSHEGKQQGPFSIEIIVNKIKNSELTLVDYIFDQEKNDWVLMMEYPLLARQLQDNKPSAPPQSKNYPEPSYDEGKTDPAIVHRFENSLTQPVFFSAEWYVLKGENKFGPFSYGEIIRMLQNKVVYEFDFAWHSGLSHWVRIAELEAFKPTQISKIKDSDMPEISEVFFRRRHRRVRFGGTILIHDNQNVWKGTGVEISAGGAGVVMENSMVVPGQVLYLHFKPGDGVPPFNATCEVVSKQYVEGVKDRKTPIRYGLKFTAISSSTQNMLSEFTKNHEVA